MPSSSSTTSTECACQLYSARSTGSAAVRGAAGSAATLSFPAPATGSTPSAISCSIASPPASLILIDAVPWLRTA